MIISTEYKFIYLANPKTGSTSVRDVLRPFANQKLMNKIVVNPHMPFSMLKEKARDFKIDLAEYFIFTTVINPWKRMVSNFFYRKDDRRGLPWYHKNYDKSTAGEYSFFQYISNVLGDKNRDLDPYWSGCGCPNLKNFIQDSGCEVYKIENFCLETLLLDIHSNTSFRLDDLIVQDQLPVLNTTQPNKTQNYQQYYIEQWMIDKVARIYSSDIEYGNYKF